jgi:hypothetical protein
MSEYSHADFTRLLLEGFPQLRESIQESDGLLHIEMGEFAEFAQQAKGRGDWDTYSRCMTLADRLWSRPQPALLNALNVSFFERLEFDGPRGPKAWSLLSPALQRGWQEMMDYRDRLKASAGKVSKKPRPGAA